MSEEDEGPQRRGQRRRMLIAVGTLGVVVAGVGAALVAVGQVANPFGPPDPLGAIAACEAGLKKSLVAPSSYRRVSARAVELPASTKSEYRAFSLSVGCEVSENPRICREIHQDGGAYLARDPENRKLLGITGPIPKTRDKAHEVSSDAAYALYLKWPAAEQRTAAAEIVYDAVNSYNAPIRNTKLCRFGPVGKAEKYEEGRTFDPDAKFEHLD